MKTTLGLIAVAALVTGCASDANNAVHKDVRGNYATTANYNAMDRDAFTAAMNAGLADFDTRLASLQTQAEALGPDAIEEYHDCLDGLMQQRRTCAAEIERHSAMLAGDWSDHREDVAEMYVDLRNSLDDAFDEVVEEA